jgi:hypothetical protein
MGVMQGNLKTHRAGLRALPRKAMESCRASGGDTPSHAVGGPHLCPAVSTHAGRRRGEDVYLL